MKEDIDYLTVNTVYIPKSGCCGYYTSLYVLPVRRWLSISGGNQAFTFGIASTLGYEAGQWQSPWPVPSCPGHSYWAGTSVVLPFRPARLSRSSRYYGFTALHVYALVQRDKKTTRLLCPHMVAFEYKSGVGSHKKGCKQPARWGPVRI